MLKTIGARLREARERAKLTQGKVCESVGIPKNQTLSAYERGINNPPLETLAKLAKLYRVSIDWIVYGDESQMQRTKRTADYITDLFTTLDKLGLWLDEEIEFNGNPTGRYIIHLTNKNLKCFDLLISDLYKLSAVKDILDPDDYETLVQKRIRDRAAESNDFEDELNRLYTLSDGDDCELPF